MRTETDWGSRRRGCPLGLLVALGVIFGLVMVGYCGVAAATYPALLLAWPTGPGCRHCQSRRRVLSGWSYSCGTYNDDKAGVCWNCGGGRTS